MITLHKAVETIFLWNGKDVWSPLNWQRFCEHEIASKLQSTGKAVAMPDGRVSTSITQLGVKFMSNAGEMTLTSLPGNVSRWEGVQAMLKADAGKIEEAKHVQSEKIAAFILEPNSSGKAASLVSI